jgi:isoamylase
MHRWAEIEGAPSPLGLTWIAEQQAYNFALYSRHATAVALLLYALDDPLLPIVQVPLNYLINKSGRVWHCRLPAATVNQAAFYAYRVDGPHDPAAGQRFDAEKILLDPYARSVYFPPQFSREAATRAGSNDGKAPLGLLHPIRDSFDWRGDKRVRHGQDTIIYEMHVKGFTKRSNSGVSAEKRGTYAGVVEKIPYLKDLGVTVVELLPVHQRDPQEDNYWGYMTLNFFSPEQAYAVDVNYQMDEFRAMVKALHQAGIEVVLDVVYNHTTEGDQSGPNYSFRGIDNTTYYLLEADRRWYRNDTGCGNTLHTANPATRKLILDSMRHWIQHMHVDGFRFDLASIFSRNDDGSVNLEDPPIISTISSEPEFANARLIAEAWDLSSYQLGRAFPGFTWYQWNGTFRDDVRAFVRGDNGMINRLMTRIYGSDDLFPDSLEASYHAYQSVNFVDCHDGFNLYDLVAYNSKHNLANGHGNGDGTDANFSWNCGWEGDDAVPPEVLALRKRQVKNFCALLMLANGTPMFCAGDEFMHTQQGNNNPYNQDNETTWLDWDKLETNRDVFRFFQQMIAFRKAHPSLGRSRFWREDIRWYGVNHEPDRSAESHSLAYCLHGARQHDVDIYVMVNSSAAALSFTIQEGHPGSWRRVIDTARASPEDFCAPGSEVQVLDLAYPVEAHSVVMLRR